MYLPSSRFSSSVYAVACITKVGTNCVYKSSAEIISDESTDLWSEWIGVSCIVFLETIFIFICGVLLPSSVSHFRNISI